MGTTTIKMTTITVVPGGKCGAGMANKPTTMLRRKKALHGGVSSPTTRMVVLWIGVFYDCP
jgi:hypothetical protein